METFKRVNVAPSSDEGHYVEKARNIIDLDVTNETFIVEGESELVTKNHTTLKMEEDCLITCQNVYNPLSKIFEKSRD